jgi:hypothetical protein
MMSELTTVECNSGEVAIDKLFEHLEKLISVSTLDFLATRESTPVYYAAAMVLSILIKAIADRYQVNSIESKHRNITKSKALNLFNDFQKHIDFMLNLPTDQLYKRTLKDAVGKDIQIAFNSNADALQDLIELHRRIYNIPSFIK